MPHIFHVPCHDDFILDVCTLGASKKNKPHPCAWNRSPLCSRSQKTATRGGVECFRAKTTAGQRRRPLRRGQGLNQRGKSTSNNSSKLFFMEKPLEKETNKLFHSLYFIIILFLYSFIHFFFSLIYLFIYLSIIFILHYIIQYDFV